MHPDTIRALNQTNRGTSGNEFHLTGMKNVADLAFSSSSSSGSSNQTEPETHGAFLQGLIGEAKEGGEHVTEEPTADPLAGTAMSAAQLANVQNILATLGGQQVRTYEPDHWERERARHMTEPLDINVRPNYTHDPVYYRPQETFAKSVAGVPYQVSDIINICRQCTYRRKCERHSEKTWTKTSVSLCAESHLRMTVSWDVTDVENRNGTWRFDIESKFDRFPDPEGARAEHEHALHSLTAGGCHPHEPVNKIKDLALRIIEDHNEHQTAKARLEFLDHKGREYFAQPKRWGGKEPFKPSKLAHTRAAYQYVPLDTDSNRVERELRLLLQAWHKSKVAPENKMRDRTTANMKEAWAFKMAEEAAARKAKKAVEELTAGAFTSLRGKKMRKEPSDRFKMSTWDQRVLDTEKAEPVETPKPMKKRAASRELNAEERKILESMSKAAKIEAHATAEKEALQHASSASDLPLPKPKIVKEKTASTASKRKAPTDDTNTSRNKKFKSADLIADSDDEANYQLPTAPTAQLPEQREGWDHAETLSNEIQVVQSDDADVPETTMVVEQGTTIVKEIEAEAKVEDVNVQEAITPPSYASPPRTPTSPKKRKVAFASPTSSPSKKAKKVSFTDELLSPKSAPRKLSAVYARSSMSSESGDEDEDEGAIEEVLGEIMAAEIAGFVESEDGELEEEEEGYQSEVEEDDE